LFSLEVGAVQERESARKKKRRGEHNNRGARKLEHNTKIYKAGDANPTCNATTQTLKQEA